MVQKLHTSANILHICLNTPKCAHNVSTEITLFSQLVNKLNFSGMWKISMFTNSTNKFEVKSWIVLADVDGFKICIQVCVWLGFRLLIILALTSSQNKTKYILVQNCIHRNVFRDTVLVSLSQCYYSPGEFHVLCHRLHSSHLRSPISPFPPAPHGAFCFCSLDTTLLMRFIYLWQ